MRNYLSTIYRNHADPADAEAVLELILEKMTAENWAKGELFPDLYTACLIGHVAYASGLSRLVDGDGLLRPPQLEEESVTRRTRAVKFLSKAIRNLGLHRGRFVFGESKSFTNTVVTVNDDSDIGYEDATLIVKHALELAREAKAMKDASS